MSNLVSIVMAAKNYAKFLPQAVESAFAQTYPHWELLIIDDGSTDATPEAVRPYLNDPRLKYIRSDFLGQSRAKNLGARLSKGEFIAYLDADDAWEPTKLEKQLKLFERPETGVVFSGRKLIDESGKVTAEPPANFPKGKVLANIFTQNFVCFSTVMLRREVFDYVGGFDPGVDLSIDYDLWLRVAKHYEFDYVPEPLVLYRTGHGNLSKKLSDRVATAFCIKNRALYRRGLVDEIPSSIIAKGYGSTCQTLAYVMRPSEPLTAMRWYWRAMQWPGHRVAAAKGIVASALNLARGRRVPGSAENASANA
jgi:glycosyltransferase involved in cell wall biosynthesis